MGGELSPNINILDVGSRAVNASRNQMWIDVSFAQ